MMIKNMVGALNRASFTAKMIYLYVILLPISSSFLSNKGVGKVQLSDPIFIIILFSWIFGRTKVIGRIKGKNNRTLFFILAIFLILTLSSSLNSMNLFHSAVDWIGIVYLATLFMIIVSVIDTREEFIGLLVAYSIGAVIASLIGLSALFFYYITRNAADNAFLVLNKYEASLIPIPRIKSFFYTPNMFSSFAHVGFVALLSLFFLTDRGPSPLSKSVKLISISVVTISLFLTGSQTMAGFVLTLFLTSFLFKSKVISVIRYMLFPITIAILLFAACATIWMIFPIKIDMDPQSRDLDIRINYAYSYHILPSVYAMSMLRKHPIIGVGIGTFADQYPSYINIDIDKITAAKQGMPAGLAIDPHNTYSGALAEWGILGFLGMLSIFMYMFSILTRTASTKNNHSYESVRRVLLAGLIGFLISAFFIDSMMLRHFWLFMAFIVIFDNIIPPENTSDKLAFGK